MTKPLFTKEEAERLADEWAGAVNPIAAFRAGIAAAESEFQKRLEEAPKVYGGIKSGHYWETVQASHDTHTAKLMNIEPIEEKP